MDDKQDPVVGLISCAVILLVIVGWLLLWHGPISWFFFGASLAAFLLMEAGERIKKAGAKKDEAEEAEKKKPGLKARALSGAASGGMKFAVNLAIGFGIVLVLQVAFGWWGTGADATTYGNLEQRFWGWLVQLKDLVTNIFSLAAMALLVLLAVAFNSWWPVAATAKARKWISNVISVLAAVFAFSLVTAAPAESRYGMATQGVRFAFLGKLDGLAVQRKEEAAYQWAKISWDKKLSEPAFETAFDAYLNSAVDSCVAYNVHMEERTAAAIEDFPDPPPNVRWAQIHGVVDGRLTSGVLRGFFPACEPPELSPVLANNMAVVEPDEAPLDRWTPDFTVKRQSAGFISQAEWKQRFDAVEAAQNASTDQAIAARDAIKGALTRQMGKHLTEDLGLPADPFLNILRDAALGALAADAEGKVRRWLERAAARDTRLAAASRRALIFAFPDSEFVKTGIFYEQARNLAAEKAMDAVVPDAQRYAETASRDIDSYRDFIRTEAEREERRQAAEVAAAEERRRIWEREILGRDIVDPVRPRPRPRIRGR